MNNLDQEKIGPMDNNDLQLNYIDKIYANYRDTTIKIGRLQYVLFFLSFLLAYIVFAKITNPITPFGLIAIKPEHATLLLPLILGFIYMVIGGYNIYNNLLLRTIVSLYEDFGLPKNILKEERSTKLLRPPSFTNVLLYLFESGGNDSKTVEYAFSSMNLLRIITLYVLPLTMLMILTVPHIISGQNSFMVISLKLAVYLLLPGLGFVAITWEYHSAYYNNIEEAIAGRFSKEMLGNKLEPLSWFFGILVINIVAIVSYLFLFFCYITIKSPINETLNWLLLIRNISLSFLSISFLTVVIGLFFGHLLRYIEKFKKKNLPA